MFVNGHWVVRRGLYETSRLGRVRSAFCAGAYLAVILFAIMLGYLVVRRRLQPYTQRTAWTSRDDYDDQ